MKYYKFVGNPDEYVFTKPIVGKVYSGDSILSEKIGNKVEALYKCWPDDWQEVDYPNMIKIGNGDGTYSTSRIVVGGSIKPLSKTTKIGAPQTEVFQSKVSYVLKGIEEMLVTKNKKYGNSALEPSNVFSKLPAKEGLLLRIDDKLKRISNGSYENDDEDVINDLIGYLVLLKIVDNE